MRVDKCFDECVALFFYQAHKVHGGDIIQFRGHFSNSKRLPEQIFDVGTASSSVSQNITSLLFMWSVKLFNHSSIAAVGGCSWATHSTSPWILVAYWLFFSHHS